MATVERVQDRNIRLSMHIVREKFGLIKTAFAQPHRMKRYWYQKIESVKMDTIVLNECADQLRERVTDSGLLMVFELMKKLFNGRGIVDRAPGAVEGDGIF